MITFEEAMQVTSGVSSVTALSDEEARGMYDALAQVTRDGLVVEVGTQLGRSSSLITQLAHDIGFHVLHIDPYTQQTDMAKQWLGMMAAVGTTFLLAHMRTDQADWLLQRLGPIDLAYIDGDHCGPGVRIDLALVADRVRSGGLLLCHDYGRDSLPDVFQVVNQYLESDLWDHVGTYGTLGVWRRQ